MKIEENDEKPTTTTPNIELLMNKSRRNDEEEKNYFMSKIQTLAWTHVQWALFMSESIRTERNEEKKRWKFSYAEWTHLAEVGKQQSRHKLKKRSEKL